ncbi:uncharacterized protein BDZ99DRAFT_480013 [Mytilinidion resinicola]|uniref:Lysine-specific metallo-endopeptidase domain-containing protein n=1 Tax=Mytilinidion resinicola TaxID=574789 RepID=A0A6A6YDT2_9PEZI|nr:uncharacterized protein BDZ99DRAFT_480013 [Mytilinidion resinicola]KAF2806007.1 hypothetical protein BDZ99DRAFT_480013 [Mytilinidion resinicola]
MVVLTEWDKCVVKDKYSDDDDTKKKIIKAGFYEMQKIIPEEQQDCRPGDAGDAKEPLRIQYTAATGTIISISAPIISCSGTSKERLLRPWVAGTPETCWDSIQTERAHELMHVSWIGKVSVKTANYMTDETYWNHGEGKSFKAYTPTQVKYLAYSEGEPFYAAANNPQNYANLAMTQYMMRTKGFYMAALVMPMSSTDQAQCGTQGKIHLHLETKTCFMTRMSSAHFAAKYHFTGTPEPPAPLPTAGKVLTSSIVLEIPPSRHWVD